MKFMKVTASNGLLGLDGPKNGMNSIGVSVSGNSVSVRYVGMGHSMRELRCKECDEVRDESHTGDADPTLIDQYPQDPSEAGGILTTSGVPRVDTLSGFKLDSDFPHKGTMIELSIMERWALIETKSQKDESLRFDRNQDYSNILEVF